MTTVADILRDARRRVQAANVSETPMLDVDLVVGDVLGLDRAGLRAYDDRPVSDDEQRRVGVSIERLVNAEPVQYILGRAWFRDLELAVDERVLVPRPETEQLVDVALEQIAQLRAAAHGAPETMTVVDACTGSGCVAIAVDREAAERWGEDAVRVLATELSDDAADVAVANVVRCDARVEVRRGSMLEPIIAAADRAHVIVANAPYVGRDEAQSLAARVRDFEPHVALFAPADLGVVGVLRGIAEQARQVLMADGLVALEHGMGQRSMVCDMMRELGYRDVCGLDDLAGVDRIVCATWPGEDAESGA